MAAGKSGRKGGLVYSTEKGEMCPGCERPRTVCACSTATPAVARSGPVRVGRQTKARRGKGVTVITGLPLDPPALAELARELRKKCGAGGVVREGVIEIQGEHRDRLVAELRARGWDAKRSGG
jgi:translation initiation factor 1